MAEPAEHTVREKLGAALLKLHGRAYAREAVHAFTDAGERANQRREMERITEEKAAGGHNTLMGAANEPHQRHSNRAFFSMLWQLIRGNLTIVPDRSDALGLWRLFIVFLVVAQLAMLPYHFAFRPSTPPFSFLWIIDILLFCDVLLNLRVAFVERGMVRTEPRAVFFRYLSSLLIPDLLASIPLERLLWPPLAAFRFGRFLKLPATMHYYSRWETFSQMPSLTRLLRLSITIFLSVHLIACCYVVLSRVEGFGSSTYVLSNAFAEGGEKHSSIYLFAFYWSSSLLLSNPLGVSKPETDMEVFFQTCLDLLSVAIFATIVGEASHIIAELGSLAQEHRQRMAGITQFLAARDVPPGLARRIKSYFDFLWSRQQGVEDQEILDQLPRHLRSETLLFLYRGLLRRVAFFQDCEDNFFATLASFLKPQIYSPHDYIITFGDVGEEMFFLAKGTVEIVNSDGRVVATLTSGSYFGEIALVTTENRTASVRAVTYCDVLSLCKDHFDYVLSKFPREGEIIKRVASQRLLYDKKLRLLRRLPLLQNCSTEFRESLLAELTPVTFESGVMIFKVGEQGDDMYFVARGFVECLDEEGEVLTTLSDGAFFGEIALVFRQARSASVRSTSRTECFRLTRAAFERVLKEHPNQTENIRKVAEERRQRSSQSGLLRPAHNVQTQVSEENKKDQ